MFAVNFEIRAVVFEGDVQGDRGKRQVVSLSFDRDFSDVELDDEVDWDGATIQVMQSQGLITCVDTTPTAKFAKGDPEHDLLHGVIGFMNKWCQKNSPFKDA